MNENLNLVEILKDCPMGTKLYCTILGDVTLSKVVEDPEGCTDNPIIVSGYDDGDVETFTQEGLLLKGLGECVLFPSKDQRDWSKFKPEKPKFDPKTLQPFDRILTRDAEANSWRCTLYSHKSKGIYKYITADYAYKYCIPYNDDTKHLVGTTEEAPEFYRYWED